MCVENVPLIGVPNQKLLLIGNEISQSSPDFINGLRGIFDEYAGRILGLFTDNHFDYLLEKYPQVFDNQRVCHINFNYIEGEDLFNYLKMVVEKEGISNISNAELNEIVKMKKPSIRGCLVTLQLSGRK